jgi:hypothetical protein
MWLVKREEEKQQATTDDFFRRPPILILLFHRDSAHHSNRCGAIEQHSIEYCSRVSAQRDPWNRRCIVSLNGYITIPATDTQYKFKSMIWTQHGTATNYYADAYGDARLCAWHPRVKDTTSFHQIVSQHCCFMTVDMMHCWCLLVCLASLWKRHYILSLDCQSTLLLHDSRYDVHPTSRDKSKSCWKC